MLIKDRPEYKTKQNPLTMPGDASVQEAVTKMAAKGYGSVIIIDNDNHVDGIVTERDLMVRLIGQEKDPKTTKLKEIMTTDVRVAQEDDNLLDWLRIMSNERFRRLPIVDSEGKIVSVMSQGDFVSYTWPELFKRVTENAKATLGAGYQIIMIVAALLIYALVINLFL